MTSKQNCNRNIIHFSGFEIESEDRFGFDPDDYSKFKYGASNIARKFGYELADRFIKECFSKTYDGTPLVIVPSAYSHIPTASFCMKKFFVDKLNDYLFRNNFPITGETKIYRSVTYREDYGEMSADDRYKLISGDSFHMDKEYVRGKRLLFLDDIKITGTHERIILKMLDELEIYNDCYMLYFAELVNSGVSPTIENYLNNFYVKSLAEVDSIIRNEVFVFNTRVVKFILNSRPEEFDLFLEKQNIDFVRELYYNAIGNEYFKFSSYLRNLKVLETIVAK